MIDVSSILTKFYFVTNVGFWGIPLTISFYFIKLKVADRMNYIQNTKEEVDSSSVSISGGWGFSYITNCGAPPPSENFVHSKCAYMELVFSIANLTKINTGSFRS